ncbi:histidine kinase [Actinokineospora sp. NBRC 105648]|uniref:sensor histidine kinase n=1 Tax=Actinokineospora sp. NBRC 105648 TaxID=3032206 RepID=UPI002552BA92|nr:histidine kinase [Actinokineospora sp. NBRC 105648]
MRRVESRARECERLRLHRDLHDDLGPALAGIRLRLDAVSARLGGQPEIRRLVADAATETARTMTEIRRVVDGLPPPDLVEAGLPGALRRLGARLDGAAATVPDGAAATVVVDVPDELPGVSPTAELAVYRIAAEALTNVLRHSGARAVGIELTATAAELVLEVLDDGSGRPPAGWWGHGTGLHSMRQRAEAAGGSCVVLLWPDGRSGTLVRAVLPRGAV